MADKSQKKSEQEGSEYYYYEEEGEEEENDDGLESSSSKRQHTSSPQKMSTTEERYAETHLVDEEELDQLVDVPLLTVNLNQHLDEETKTKSSSHYTISASASHMTSPAQF